MEEAQVVVPVAVVIVLAEAGFDDLVVVLEVLDPPKRHQCQLPLGELLVELPGGADKGPNGHRAEMVPIANDAAVTAVSWVIKGVSFVAAARP